MVTGDRRPYLVALIVVDPEQIIDKSDDQINNEVAVAVEKANEKLSQVEKVCLLYTSPSPRDSCASRMPSSA